jgi:hypothetical protein
VHGAATCESSDLNASGGTQLLRQFLRIISNIDKTSGCAIVEFLLLIDLSDLLGGKEICALSLCSQLSERVSGC